jgi:hypothetical protein
LEHGVLVQQDNNRKCRKIIKTYSEASVGRARRGERRKTKRESRRGKGRKMKKIKLLQHNIK